ncbi:MAG: hypothetical protein AAGE98_16605, partial [Actinomycetota bacterium]
ETSVALNPDSLHTLLRDAPHNDDVVERFAAFRLEMSDVLATHLIALGHPEDRATLRARLVFDLVDQFSHGETIDEPGADDEVIRIVAGALVPTT